MHDTTAANIVRLLTTAPAEDLRALISVHASDTRASVVSARERAERRLGRALAERARLDRMAELQASLHADGVTVVAGVDEVGRGCVAGPVSAAAVVLPASARIEGIDDSKRLTPETRVELDAAIRGLATRVAVAHIDATVIDRIGIAAANTLAMRTALEGLGIDVDHVLVDGLPVELGIPSTAIVGGDRLVSAIAAASIVAKVARDALMRSLDAEYPAYDFAANKGYGTAEHLETIARIGPCAIHRMSFAPCSQRALF